MSFAENGRKSLKKTRFYCKNPLFFDKLAKKGNLYSDLLVFHYFFLKSTKIIENEPKKSILYGLLSFFSDFKRLSFNPF